MTRTSRHTDDDAPPAADAFGNALDSTLNEQYAAGTITLTELNQQAGEIGAAVTEAPPPDDPPADD